MLMRSVRSSLFVVALALSFVPGRTASAQTVSDGKHVTVTVLFGADALAEGKFSPAASTSGRFGTVTLFAHSLSDVQTTPVHFGVDLGYGWSTTEFVARVKYSAAGSQAFDFAKSHILDSGETFTLEGVLSGYRGWTIQGGFRERFLHRGVIDSYVGGLAGVTIVQPQTIEIDNGITTSTQTFYSRSVPLTLTAVAGVTVGVSPRLSVGVETGLQYLAPLTVEESATIIVPPQYWDFSRWSVPVTGTVRYRF